MILLYAPLQVLAAAAWTSANVASIVLFRVYWRVLQKSREVRREPRWQEHDRIIGVYPPCKSCDACIPIEQHKTDCGFLAAIK